MKERLSYEIYSALSNFSTPTALNTKEQITSVLMPNTVNQQNSYNTETIKLDKLFEVEINNVSAENIYSDYVRKILAAQLSEKFLELIVATKVPHTTITLGDNPDNALYKLHKARSYVTQLMLDAGSFNSKEDNVVLFVPEFVMEHIKSGSKSAPLYNIYSSKNDKLIFIDKQAFYTYFYVQDVIVKDIRHGLVLTVNPPIYQPAQKLIYASVYAGVHQKFTPPIYTWDVKL